jgi:putative ABC transport system permease protein
VPVGSLAPEEFALVLRTAGEPPALAAAAKAAIRRLVPDSPVEVATMRRLASDWTAPRRFQVVLTSLVALFALTLAAIGIFGLLSYTVAARERELGIRIALGASRRRVVATVVRRAALLALGGGLLGLAAALPTLPLLRSLLYGVEPLDPVVFAAATLVLLAAATAAALTPAWRAARLDPAASLRTE